MNYGLYLSASGVLTNMHRQDVIANNLANANTTGFKRALSAFRQRDPEVIEDQLGMNAKQPILDQLGGGVFAHRPAVDYSPGSYKQTGNDLDVSIRGDGFFAVRISEDGKPAMRFTRDGRFAVDTSGQLITTTGGHAVLNHNDEPIVVDRNSPIRIDERGQITQAGQEVGRIGLWQVSDSQQLQQRGNGLYEANAALMKTRVPGGGSLEQGWVEQSNVDPVREMTQLIEATRAIANGSNLIRYQDAMLERTVGTLGRVSV